MNFTKLKRQMLSQITVNKRLKIVCLWYLLFLMVSFRKHSLTAAAKFSRLATSQISRFLKYHADNEILNRFRSIFPVLLGKWEVLLKPNGGIGSGAGMWTLFLFHFGYSYPSSNSTEASICPEKNESSQFFLITRLLIYDP